MLGDGMFDGVYFGRQRNKAARRRKLRRARHCRAKPHPMRRAVDTATSFRHPEGVNGLNT